MSEMVQAALEAAMQDLEQGAESGDDIAAKLQEMGIRGRRQCDENCPVAHYVIQRLGSYFREDWSVAVGEMGTEVYDGRGDEQGLSDWAETVVPEFINSFDDGMYPDLVA